MEDDVWQRCAVGLLVLLISATAVEGVINNDVDNARLSDRKCEPWWLYPDSSRGECYHCMFAIKDDRNIKVQKCKSERMLGEAIYKEVDNPTPGARYDSVPKCDTTPLLAPEVYAKCSSNVIKYAKLENKVALPGAECTIYCKEGYIPVLEPGTRIQCASCTNKTEFCQWNETLPDVLCQPPPDVGSSTTSAPDNVVLHAVTATVTVTLALILVVVCCVCCRRSRRQRITKEEEEEETSSTTSIASLPPGQEEDSQRQSLLTISGADQCRSPNSDDEVAPVGLTSITSTESGDTTDTGYGSEVHRHEHVHNHTYDGCRFTQNVYHTTVLKADTINTLEITQTNTNMSIGSVSGKELDKLEGTADNPPQAEAEEGPTTTSLEGPSERFHTCSETDGEIGSLSERRDSIPFCDHGLVAEESPVPSPSGGNGEEAADLVHSEIFEHSPTSPATDGATAALRTPSENKHPSLTLTHNGGCAGTVESDSMPMKDTRSLLPKAKSATSEVMARDSRCIDSGIGTANSEVLRSNIQHVAQHDVVPQTARLENLDGLVTIDDSLDLHGIALESENQSHSSTADGPGITPLTMKLNRGVEQQVVKGSADREVTQGCEQHYTDSLPLPVPVTDSPVYSKNRPELDIAIHLEQLSENDDIVSSLGRIRQGPVGSSDHLNCLTNDTESESADPHPVTATDLSGPRTAPQTLRDFESSPSQYIFSYLDTDYVDNSLCRDAPYVVSGSPPVHIPPLTLTDRGGEFVTYPFVPAKHGAGLVGAASSRLSVGQLTLNPGACPSTAPGPEASFDMYDGPRHLFAYSDAHGQMPLHSVSPHSASAGVRPLSAQQPHPNNLHQQPYQRHPPQPRQPPPQPYPQQYPQPQQPPPQPYQPYQQPQQPLPQPYSQQYPQSRQPPPQPYPPQYQPQQHYPQQQQYPQAYPEQQQRSYPQQYPPQSPHQQPPHQQPVQHTSARSGGGLVIHAGHVGNITQEHRRTTSAPREHIEHLARQNSDSPAANVSIHASRTGDVVSLTYDHNYVTS